MDTKNNSSVTNISKRKLKKLYTKIKKQMEFYFSDSNLAKDKFLSDLISKDPDGYVDLKIFCTFNKIKVLTENCEVIAASVSRSSMFEISQDCKRVKRSTPVDLSKDFDACTLYVERLPSHADQKWIQDVFGHFGSVKHVNVPRYKFTNRIKGFAFVEFDSPGGVQNACEFYKMASEKECTTSEDEGKNAKNGKKHKHEESTERKGKKGRTRTVSESSEKLTDVLPSKSDIHHRHHYDSSQEHEKELLQNKKRKRKREDSVGEDASKKSKEYTVEEASLECSKSENSKEQLDVKMEESTAENHNPLCATSEGLVKENSNLKVEESTTSKEKVSTMKESFAAEAPSDHTNESELEESKISELDENKSKRKRKNTKKHRSHTDKPLLRVMPKSEWKAYRNKYLELQRSTMSVLKRQILLEMQELKEEESNSKTAESHDAKRSLQFQPCVIIKVKLADLVKNSSDIKDQVKANAVVAYIDAPVDSSEIFIRCHSPEEALAIIKEDKLNLLGKAELLRGDEEKQYWDKIESDRKLKISNPVPHKKRGRDKLIAKAAKLEEMKNKHIYFDE